MLFELPKTNHVPNHSKKLKLAVLMYIKMSRRSILSHFMYTYQSMSSVHWVTIEFRRPRDKNLDDCNPEKKFYTFLWETILVCNVVEYWKLSYICKCIIWRGLCIKYVCKKYSQFLIALIWWIRSKHAIATIIKATSHAILRRNPFSVFDCGVWEARIKYSFF